MSMIIKVCGMKYDANIKDLQTLDVNLMGMIFYPKSSRFITSIPKVDKRIKYVGVFVNEKNSYIDKIIDSYSLDFVQLHGNESPDDCKYFSDKGIKVIKAFGIDDDFNFESIVKYENYCDYFIFDTKTKNYGGSGRKFNWSKLNEYKGSKEFLLSGGIGPDDINEVLQFSHEYCVGVDLNSGFEEAAGLKNIEKLKVFIKEYRNTNG